MEAFCNAKEPDDPDFVNIIKANKLSDKHILKNIIVKYFNGIDVDVSDLNNLKHIDYLPTKDLFYQIPFTIFILMDQLKRMLST